jgi:putative oxidoreductase
MDGFLGRYSTYIYALMRFVAGFLILWHGTQKLLGYPPSQGGGGEGLSALMAVAGTIELIGGLMVMFGLFAGVAAFVLSGLMAVAYFMAHFSFAAFLPIQNRGELAVLYCFVFLFIASRGSGVWSIDSIFRAGGSSAVS